ncbi:SAM-dependent methyltransferase [Pseudoruegeria sp. HB172150]|uniref:SAM-dependent methyltransferase n=1 Tax=Pseudoruegeria sp. HB172150 TaxID=2721164 RepID=UPI0015540022|nr:SAM-dependent methyltransferase [Pseudoruegeria sp. HB172150]
MGLTVVGTGICFPSQMTFEAADAIKMADITLFNVGNHAIATDWLRSNARAFTDLYEFYAEGKNRTESYEEMVDAILTELHAGKTVVAAFYGHPGVFVGPGFEAIKRARKEGFDARMLPGVSAVDCMFADLEFDPAPYGCRMVEATDYVLMDRDYDPRTPLIIWQAGVVGDMTFNIVSGPTSQNTDLLKTRLLRDYPEDHPIISYVAATLAGMKPQTGVATVGTLETLKLNASSTCLVPPVFDHSLDAELGVPFQTQLLQSIREAQDRSATVN